ncbi:MAG: hypothetical protein AAF799_34475 [Myxococcota bacterium]
MGPLRICGRSVMLMALWAAATGLLVMAFATLPLYSSSGFYVGPFILPLLWVVLMGMSAPWAWRWMSVSPVAENRPVWPEPKLEHLDPQLRREVAQLIDSARTVRQCLAHDGDEGQRLVWDWTHDVDEVSPMAHAYLELHRGAIDPVRAMLTAEPTVMATARWRNELRQALVAFEDTLVSCDPAIGYRAVGRA